MTLEQLKSTLNEFSQKRAESIEFRENLKSEYDKTCKSVDALSGAIQAVQLLIQKEESASTDGSS
jgi:hypothetical protein